MRINFEDGPKNGRNAPPCHHYGLLIYRHCFCRRNLLDNVPRTNSADGFLGTEHLDGTDGWFPSVSTITVFVAKAKGG